MTHPLQALRDREFALQALVDEAGALLADATGIEDERVAQLPDVRTLRYYQTLGLMDRPVRYDGRRAIYGYRSLLQAVCVKLLQGQGHSLAQCQQALAGAPTAQLEVAVGEALAHEAAPPPARPAPVEPARWLAAELAPGVVLSVDPQRIPDPEALIRRLAALLQPTNPEDDHERNRTDD